MKVSNASKNIPNCIRSLKLNLFFMCTTPILFRMKVKPPCNTIAPWLQCIIVPFVLQCVFSMFRHARHLIDATASTEHSDHAPVSCMAVSNSLLCFPGKSRERHRAQAKSAWLCCLITGCSMFSPREPVA